MYKIITLLTLAFSTATYAGKLKVVTTTSDLASITEAVAGDFAAVKSICSGNQDPHHLQARPKYIMMARNANLWIRTGMELEIGWEMPVIDGSRNRKIRPGNLGHLDAYFAFLKHQEAQEHAAKNVETEEAHPIYGTWAYVRKKTWQLRNIQCRTIYKFEYCIV